MINPLEQLRFKRKTFTLTLIRIDDFFEGKQIIADALVSHQVYRSESPLAEQPLDLVTASYNTPNRECLTYFLHNTPQTTA